MDFHMINITYAALHMRAEKTTFSRRLYIDEAHTALDIFRFAVFFFKNSYPVRNFAEKKIGSIIIYL